MREHIQSIELWDMKNEQGPTFINTTTIWKEDGQYYQYTHLERVRPDEFDFDSLPRPDPIPMEIFKARWKPSLTECSPPFPDDSYLKSPPILLPSTCDPHIIPGGQPRPRKPNKVPGDDMMAEAEIYEILKNHPHPNICVYYGCVREGNYLTAICLKKYERTLKSAVDSGTVLDRDAILNGISAGLRHLHDTLGFVHNDINHTNIMLDSSSSPIIIDFDSCVPIGEGFGSRKRATYG
jgi:serine/threonine protein kinase